MKKTHLSLLTAALFAGHAAAQTTAITNATIHTGTELGVLKDASIVFEEGKIIAINPESIEADTVIDANDAIVTAGIISSMNQLGLVEVGAVASSRDASDKKAGMSFDASPAYNPKSSLIPYARKGGITTDIIAPWGGEGIFKGVASYVELTSDFDAVLDNDVAMIVSMGAKSKGSRAMSIHTLFDKFEAQKSKLEKADKKDKKDKKEPSDDEKLLTQVLKGEMPLVVRAERASDLKQLLKFKATFSDVNLVLAGANDAVVIADDIAKAGVPVLLSAMSNLPGNFDSLHAHLENAAKLEKAGVKVLLTVTGDSSHNMYQLRFDAGNAVSYGMSYDGALAAVTSNVADVFGLNAGRLAEGKRADIVLWSADPFELSTKVEKMFINGVEVSTESRHDKLRDRYTTQSDLPRAYTK